MPGEQLNDLERSKFYTDDNGLVYVRTYENGSEIDTSNSTNTPLGIDGTYTGTPIDILGFGIIYVSVYSDKASATDGLILEQGCSDDGGSTFNWDNDDKYTIPAATGKTFSIQPGSQYFRVRYVNGGVAQTEFRLNIILKKGYGLDSSHRIQDAIIDDDDARLVKAVLTAKADGDGYVNISSTASNNLKVTDAENGLAIAKGDVTGTTFVHKFGNIPDFDTADGGTGGATVWDGADDGGIDQMIYQYSSTADIDSLVSSNSGDTQDIEIQGLDSNYDLVTQTITLTGQTRVALSTDLIRVFRMKNVGSTDIAGTVSCYVNSAAPGGVVTDSTKVRAAILDGNNQTEMAIYTVPNGKTGYLRSWFASSSGGKVNTNYTIRLKAKPFGQVFQLKHRTSIADGNPIQHDYVEPEVFSAKTDIEMTGKITETGVTEAGISAGFDIVLVDD